MTIIQREWVDKLRYDIEMFEEQEYKALQEAVERYRQIEERKHVKSS